MYHGYPAGGGGGYYASNYQNNSTRPPVFQQAAAQSLYYPAFPQQHLQPVNTMADGMGSYTRSNPLNNNSYYNTNINNNNFNNPFYGAPPVNTQQPRANHNSGNANNSLIQERLQMLQLQNRILLAKQQNMMFKQTLARSYFQPPPQQNPSQFSNHQPSYNNQSNQAYPSEVPSYSNSNSNNNNNYQHQPQAQYPNVQQQQPQNNPYPNPNQHYQHNNNSNGDNYKNNYNQNQQQAPPSRQIVPQQQPQIQPPYSQPPQSASFGNNTNNNSNNNYPSLIPVSSTNSIHSDNSHSNSNGNKNNFDSPANSNILSSDPTLEPSFSTSSLPPVQSVASTSLPQRKQLRNLVSDIAQQVTSVEETMQQDRKLHLSLAEQLKEQKRAEKNRVLASLRQATGAVNNSESNVDNNLPLLPKWKHLLLGHKLPIPSAALMKMKRLWRAIAFALICVMIVPKRRAFHRKQLRRDKAAKECARSLRIFLEGIEEWVGKSVALPIQSIVEDASLDFDMKHVGHMKSSHQQAQVEKFLVPLKVRFKALLKALTVGGTSTTSNSGANNTTLLSPRSTSSTTGAGLPSAKVTAFLVGLLEDDNYFPDDFLYTCEEKVVEKNTLGGTRGLVAMSESESEVVSTMHTSASVASLASNTNSTTNLNVNMDEVHGARRLVIPIEVDIPQPTSNTLPTDAYSDENDANANDSSVSSSPSTVVKLKRFVHTGAVRMLLIDTLLVRILTTRIVLTPWHAQITKPPINRYTRRVTGNLRVLATLCYQLARKLNPSLPMREEIMAKQHVQMKTNVTSNNNISSANTSTTNVSSKVGVSEKVGGDSAASSKVDVDNTATGGGGVGKGVFGAFLRMTGFADTTPGYENFQQGSIEFDLLAPRFSAYEGLEDTMKWLLPKTQCIPTTIVQEIVDTWLEELVPLVRIWLDSVIVHVLQAYLLKHHQRLFLKPVSVVVANGNNEN